MILGESWKIQERRREGKSQEDKREFLKKRGWSIENYWEDKDREEWQRLEEKNREIQISYREESIKDSRYAEEIKEVLLGKQGRRYMERGQRLRKDALSTVARFRTGNESRQCMFLLKEEERLKIKMGSGERY